ncbi:MAG: hypothetical protein IPG79_17010 [Saprospiraceae bacterium]|nr:hypothetical protein [Saprospiraceae bacterium]
MEPDLYPVKTENQVRKDLDRVFQLATFEVTGEDINASVEMTENPNNYIGRGTLTRVKKSHRVV